MGYSKVSSMRIKNFRNIDDISIDFKESPIITLIGENEAGKTSIVKAFCVAGLNSFSKKQKNFIREGTNGFGINISLEDGTEITRIKTNASNQLTVKKPNSEPWMASKIDNGIPVELQSVMGLMEESETKELIHVRTYEDQLLFVVTPGSTNYKVMYDALKVDQLTKALKLGTEEANALKRSLDSNQLVVKALMENIRQIRIYDIEPIIAIRDRVAQQLKRLDSVENTVRIYKEDQESRKQLGAIEILEKSRISQIDMEHVNRLMSISRILETRASLINELENNKQIEALESIDIANYSKLNRLMELRSDVSRQERQLGSMSSLTEAKEVDLSLVTLLVSAMDALHRKNKYETIISKISLGDIQEVKQSSIDKLEKLKLAIHMKEQTYNTHAELKNSDARRNELTELLKASGAVVVDCPKCGESVVVDTHQYNLA